MAFKNRIEFNKQSLLCLIIASFCLCFPAFYNGYPLFFTDTNSYLIYGFSHKVDVAKVWTYAGFVRHISLHESLWFVILSQSALIASVLYLIFKYFVGGSRKRLYWLGFIIIIGSTTALSFHSSMLLADIFTPMMILCVALLLLADLNKFDKMWTMFLFFFSVSTHNANTLIVVLTLIVMIVAASKKTIRHCFLKVGITARKIILIFGCLILINLFNCCLHYSLGGSFKATKGGGIFLFARLCDFGLAQRYLNENCAKMPDCKVCPHLPRLTKGRGFLFNKHGGLDLTGGWSDENAAFYQDLSFKILQDPNIFKKYIIRVAEASLMQFFYYDFDAMSEIRHVDWLMHTSDRYFPDYKLDAQYSRQRLDNYSAGYFEQASRTQHYLIMISILFILCTLLIPTYSIKHKSLTLLLLTSVIANAIIVAAFSGVYDRYQSRVAWLLTIPLFIFISTYLDKKIKNNSIFAAKETNKLRENELTDSQSGKKLATESDHKITSEIVAQQ